MTTFTYNFSEPAGTSVTALTPPWVIRAGDDWQISSGQIRKIAGTAANNLTTVGEISSTSQEAKCRFAGTGSLHGIVVFCTVTGGLVNGYLLQASNSTNLRIRKIVNNVVSSLVSTIPVADVNDCRLTAVNLGSSVELKAFRSGVEVASFTDTTSPFLSGYAGMFANTTAGSAFLDDIEIIDVGAPLLLDLTIDANLIEDGAALDTIVGTIQGNQAGSALALVAGSDFGGAVRLEEASADTWTVHVNAAILFNPDNSKPIIGIDELLAEASNSPRRSFIQLRVIPIWQPATGTPAAVYPGATWNGTPGSGGAAPADVADDPDRGKPGLKFVNTIENMTITATENRDLFLEAYAPGGIRRVEVWCEGRTVQELSSRFVTYLRQDNGQPQSHCAYHFNLDYASFPQDGSADLYARAFPNDPDMDPIRIGPFRIHRRADEFLAEHTVNPSQAATGSNHRTIMAALSAVTTAGIYPARITVQQSLSEQIGTVSPSRDFAVDTWVCVETAPGVTVNLTGPGPGYDDNIDTRVNGLHWLGDYRFNGDTFRLIPNNESYVAWVRYSGCRFFKSNRFNLKSGRHSVSPFQPPSTDPEVNNRLILEEVLFTEMTGGHGAAWRSRNFTLQGFAADTTTNSMHTINLRAIDGNASGLRTYYTAASAIRYDGAAASADHQKTDTNASTSGTLILREAGVVVLTITDLHLKLMADIKALVEALPGWTLDLTGATNPGLAANYLTQNGTPGYGAYGPVDCKGVNSVMYIGVDLHVDGLMQHSTTGTPARNIVHVNPRGTQLELDVQGAQLSLNGLRDLYIINPVLDHVDDAISNFNMGKNGGADLYLNWNIWNPTFPRQTLVMQGGHKETNVRNGMLRQVASTTESYVASVYDRMVQRSIGTLPAGATGLAVEPSLAALFADGGAPGSTLIPNEAGPLWTGRYYSEVPFDNANNQRAKLSALGAFAAVSEAVTPPPPPPPPVGAYRNSSGWRLSLGLSL